MKKDYPQANARLAEVAKHWAEGEVSHEVWRKERHHIIKSLLASGKDWVAGETKASPKRAVSASRATLPTMAALSPSVLMDSGLTLNTQPDVANEDVLLLAVLLATMMVTAMLLLYVL